MTNCKRLTQQLTEENKIVYGLDQYNEYGVLQAYDAEQPYEDLAREFLTTYNLTGIYLKRRFETDEHLTQLIAGDPAPAEYTVTENDMEFEIRFEDYMDVGLYLDHRISRELIGTEASSKDVLNLFAYTGSFSVYAAQNNAKSVTTVDLSAKYIDWAKKNFELNDIPTEKQHEFWAMDTFEFIGLAVKTGMSYDIIVVDPPSFSRNDSNTFQVQRDHKDMIKRLQERLLRERGMLFFSTNLQSFKLDDYLRPGADKLTKKTIPEEFKPFTAHQSYVFYN